MSLFERRGDKLSRVDVATTARSVYDVTGAGDTAVAAFGACVAAGLSFKTAVHLANLSAGVKVGKRGTACVSVRELIDDVKQASTEQTLMLQGPSAPDLARPKGSTQYAFPSALRDSRRIDADAQFRAPSIFRPQCQGCQ